MSSPTTTPHRHVAPIVGRVVVQPASDISFNSTPDRLDGFRAERVAQPLSQIADRKVTRLTNPGSSIPEEIAVVASASNSLSAPKGATAPAINHQRNASEQVVAEISRIKPDIIVVAGAAIDPRLNAVAKTVGATIERIPFGAK